jgi:hypothetical protein
MMFIGRDRCRASAGQHASLGAAKTRAIRGMSISAVFTPRRAPVYLAS